MLRRPFPLSVAALAVAALAVAALGAGCVDLAVEEPAPAPGCASAAECDTGQACVAGACQPAAPACVSDADCTAAGAARCTVQSCEPGAPCADASTSCAAAAGTTEGLFPCAASEECASGACSARGTCLRLCGTDSHCPARFHCGQVPLVDGRLAVACTGGDDASQPDPERARCRSSRDCTPPRVCRVHATRLVDGTWVGEADASCEVPPGAAGSAPGDRCAGGASCASGLCAHPCDPETRAAACTWRRCTAPCAEDADCPQPYRCSGDLPDSLTGERPARYCYLPQYGCFDDNDCCWRADGTCPGSSDPTRTSCSVTATGQLCTAPPEPPLKARYAPCTSGDECASGLCVPPHGCVSPCVARSDVCSQGPGGVDQRCTDSGLPGVPAYCLPYDGDACGDGARVAPEQCDPEAGPQPSCPGPGGAAVTMECNLACQLRRDACACGSETDCAGGPCEPTTGVCGCWRTGAPDPVPRFRVTCEEYAGHAFSAIAPLAGPETGAEHCARAGLGPCMRMYGLAACTELPCSTALGEAPVVLCRCVP